ncbi:ABC transporter ATP-binding protein/permease [Escherichia coli]|uniref:ABC transporter ATP-binding protein/permease n=1 Tax=Escherichia coli TaxID=562 RepID=A0A2X3KK60_ECOLX|nr:ABC transporter ATP-binding protein/permease [Escherichia coli]
MANLLAIGGGSWMVAQGSLTLGQLTSFMMYLGLMILANAGAGMDV